MLTPLDVQKRNFKKTIRGFNEEEVNEYMEMIANTLEKHINENAMLKEKLNRRDEEIKNYRNIETTLSETLVVAKQSAQDLMNSANKEAENTVQEAQLKAKQILNDAQISIAQVALQKETMEKDLETFRMRMEAMLKAQLGVVQNYSIDLKE